MLTVAHLQVATSGSAQVADLCKGHAYCISTAVQLTVETGHCPADFF